VRNPVATSINPDACPGEFFSPGIIVNPAVFGITVALCQCFFVSSTDVNTPTAGIVDITAQHTIVASRFSVPYIVAVDMVLKTSNLS
jgi:hypothetical protein